MLYFGHFPPEIRNRFTSEYLTGNFGVMQAVRFRSALMMEENNRIV